EGKHRLIAMIPSASTSDTLGGQDARTGSTERARIETQSALREHISKIAAAVFKDTVAKSLRALVLTGSLARGEAGFDIHEGRCKVRGDSEFLVVLTDVAADPSASRKRAIIEALHEQLRLAGIDCLVSVGFVRAQYFASIQPHIFGYELKTCGVVVTGDTGILSLIPPFSCRDVPLEDGWQLLCNRIIEFIEYAHEWIQKPQNVSAEGRYRLIKLYLDMATSFLLFEAAYEPTYAGRAAKLQILADTTEGQIEPHPLPLRDFSDLVCLCTEFKISCNLNGDGSADPVMVKITTRESLLGAVDLAHSLWRWELSKLAGISQELDDSQMMDQWMKLQPISRRLPGWAYVLR